MQAHKILGSVTSFIRAKVSAASEAEPFKIFSKLKSRNKLVIELLEIFNMNYFDYFSYCSSCLRNSSFLCFSSEKAFA